MAIPVNKDRTFCKRRPSFFIISKPFTMRKMVVTTKINGISSIVKIPKIIPRIPGAEPNPRRKMPIAIISSSAFQKLLGSYSMLITKMSIKIQPGIIKDIQTTSSQYHLRPNRP
jgi:hypothetical protein